jgi:hypothetical protein
MTRDFDHYKPHLLPVVPGAEQGPDGPYTEPDWTQDIDLSGATTFSKGVWGEKKLRVLVLYGSLRERCVCLLGPSVSESDSQVIFQTHGSRSSKTARQDGL